MRKKTIIITLLVTTILIGGGVLAYKKVNSWLDQKTLAKWSSVVAVFHAEDYKGENAVSKEMLPSKYIWNSKDLEDQYAGALWNKITTHKLEGFEPRIDLTMKMTPCMGDNNIKDSEYKRIWHFKTLYSTGQLCFAGFWLEKNNGERIDTFSKLAQNFAPVESEAEAVSFIVVREDDLQNVYGIPVGHTLTISDGFLVQLIFSGNRTDVPEAPSGVIFHITVDGKYKRVAYEDPKTVAPLFYPKVSGSDNSVLRSE